MPSSSVIFDNKSDVTKCNKYEQITLGKNFRIYHRLTCVPQAHLVCHPQANLP